VSLSRFVVEPAGATVEIENQGCSPSKILSSRASSRLTHHVILVLSDHHRARPVGHVTNERFGNVVFPGPAVAEPERGQDMELDALWPSVSSGDAN
jgi:hypothetical protein